MDNIASLIESVGKLLWPILAAIVLWKLYPAIRHIMEDRGFTVKVGDMEVSVQEASDQLRSQIEDLQKKVVELRSHLPKSVEEGMAIEAVRGNPQPIRTILWVDDTPSNNAYEIATLDDEGIRVIQSTSTSEALNILRSLSVEVDAVITDMGRNEGNEFRPTAGLTLIETVRKEGVTVPIYVYCSWKSAKANYDAVLRVGGNGITASPVELFEQIHQWNSLTSEAIQ